MHIFIVRASFCSRRSPAQGGTIAGETFPGRAEERAPGRRRLKTGTEIRREQQGDPCYSAGQEGDVWGRERTAGDSLLAASCRSACWLFLCFTQRLFHVRSVDGP